MGLLNGSVKGGGLLGSTTGGGGLLGSTSGTTGLLGNKVNLAKGTSQDFYNVAVQNGLQSDADRILAQKGEQENKIFSGGFFSDIFDALNALQYGVVGVLKGRGFAEGVRTRQSWSDQDALGDLGLPGVIAGIALDIASDPLTYIAPYTILKKIPMATKVGKAIQKFAVGERILRSVETGKKITDVADIVEKGVKTAGDIEGGTKIGKWLGRKFVYMFGVDPVFKQVLERSNVNILKGTQNLVDLAKGLLDLPKNKFEQLLTEVLKPGFKAPRLVRKTTEELKGLGTFTEAELSKVSNYWDVLDNLSKEAVQLGLIPKETVEETIGRYIKNAYREYELAKGKGIGGFLRRKVFGQKALVKELTPERIAELGRIENPAYLMLKSTMDLFRDIENTKLFNIVAEKFASPKWVEGMAKEAMPAGKSFFTTAQGEIISKYQELKGLNEKLAPLFNELKKTFKADKAILGKINSTEKAIALLRDIQAEEFNKFFKEGEIIEKVLPASRKLGTLPDRLQDIGGRIKEFFKSGEVKMKDLAKTDIGMELERLHLDGVLERAGFKTKESFIERVLKPYSALEEEVTETIAKGELDKIIQAQKRIENLSDSLATFKNIDKTSINDSMRFLEKTINDIQFQKEGIKEAIDALGSSKLAGKYVPEFIKDYLTEIQRTKTPAEKAMNKIVAGFKYGKVILNPATHARNIMSNIILNWWKLGIPPWRLDLYAEGLKTTGEYAERFARQGGGLNTYAANELADLFLHPDANKIIGKFKGLGKKIADLYQAEENFAKRSAFIYGIKKGLSDEEAFKMAEAATFNYAQVTPFIRRVRESLFGFPFITFTVKATPIAAETALKAPGRISVFGKIKQSIENQADIKETARERASEPQWIKDGFFIKLPIKDKYGRSAYFDLTYIIPFGDLMSGNFFERQISRETGLAEGTLQAVARKSPFFNLIKELTSNQDFYGDKIWQDSDSTEKQLGDVMRHLTKSYLPPNIADQIPGGWIQAGELAGKRRQKGILPTLGLTKKTAEQQRSLMEEMLRNVGAKIQPINLDLQETYMESEKKKALRTLLQEKGIVADFTIPYIPKK